MSGNVNFPFAQNPSQRVPQTISFDLIIQESYPGIVFLPTLTDGAYQELREVNGCLWFVTNGLWNPNTLQWEQDLPCDPSAGAYAVEQCKDGSYTRKVALPTMLAGNEIQWVTVQTQDAAGHVIIAPVMETGVGSPGLTIAPSWNAAGSLESAFLIDVTDTASNLQSAVEQIEVNGTVVWQVRKDGTLVIGHVPVSAITGGIIASLAAGVGISIFPLTSPPVDNGFLIELSHGDYVDLANPQVIEGEKTIDTGVTLRFGPSSDGTQADTGESVAIAYGAKFQAAPFTFKAEHPHAAIMALTDDSFTLYADSGLGVGDTYNPTPIFSVDGAGDLHVYGNLQIDGNETLNGTLAVTGKSTLQATEIDGNITLGNPAVNTLGAYFVGVGHALISVTPTSGAISVDTSKLALLGTASTGLTSSDKSITITKTPGTQQADFVVSGGGIGAVSALGSNPSPSAVNAGTSLQLPALPAGTWFVEAMAGGYGLTQGDNTKTCVLDLDGNAMNTNGSVYERFLYMFEQVTSSGSTRPQVTLTGVGVMANGTGPISLTIKAVRIS